MKTRLSIKLLIFSLLLILFGSFLIYKITLPAAQDLPRQIQNGKDILSGHFEVFTKNYYSYTEPNHSFTNHHWLYGVIVYVLLGVIGWGGLVIFKVIFLLITFALLFWLALKRSDFWTVAIFSIPTIFILISRTALRPEMFSFFFLVVYLFLLLDLERHSKSYRIFLLIPLELIWLNTHLFFPIGLMLIFGFLFEKIILHYKEWKTNIVIRKLAIVSVGASSMLYFNPFGIKGVIYALWVNTSSSFPIYSMEITSIFNSIKLNPSWDNISNYLYLPLVIILIISFTVTLFIRHKRKIPLFSNNYIFYLLASVGSAVLSFLIYRALPLFGIIFLLAVCSTSNEIFLPLREWFKKQTKTIQNIFNYSFLSLFLFLLIILIIYGQRTIMPSNEQGIGLSKDALSSANFIRDNNIKGPIFNDTDSGGYLIGELYPQEKVFTDNRFGDAYSASFFGDIYLPMLRDDNKWKEALEKYNFNVIFFYHYDAEDGVRDFIYKRIYDKDWSWVYVDKFNIILVRNNMSNKSIIDKFQITDKNVDSKLKYLADSNDSNDILDAANVYNLIGKANLSMPLYLKYISLRPKSGEVWFVLGRTELSKTDQVNANPYLAVMYLENAIKNNWKTWNAYSYLALAYYRTGQIDRAKIAVEKEKQVNDKDSDWQRWMSVFADYEANQKNKNAQ